MLILSSPNPQNPTSREFRVLSHNHVRCRALFQLLVGLVLLIAGKRGATVIILKCSTLHRTHQPLPYGAARCRRHHLHLLHPSPRNPPLRFRDVLRYFGRVTSPESSGPEREQTHKQEARYNRKRRKEPDRFSNIYLREQPCLDVVV